MNTNKSSSFPSICIVGLGLIGGSLCKLIRSIYPDTIIYAISRRQETIEYAIKESIIDRGFTSLTDCPSSMSLVIVCTPISILSDKINESFSHFSDMTLVTDIGSTKKQVIKNVHSDYSDRYIPGHPMGGSECTGVEKSSLVLMKNVPYLLIKQKNEPDLFLANLSILKIWLDSLSFKTHIMSADQHDLMIGYVSHLPYLLASSLSGEARSFSDQDQQTISQVFGPGFRDTSRVAESDPSWGVDVCSTNKKALLQLIPSVIKKLTHMHTLIENGDMKELKTVLRQNKDVRHQLISATQRTP
ncbi:prephenate dehydrogenase [bacterium]|jgi:prephenate dehydrogenase|nr:prephenate dehydrogenase [bacterium]